MAFSTEEILTEQLIKVFGEEFPDISAEEVRSAAHAGWEQQNIFRMDMSAKGEEVLDYLKETGKRGIVLAGRPTMWIPRSTTAFRS